MANGGRRGGKGAREAGRKRVVVEWDISGGGICAVAVEVVDIVAVESAASSSIRVVVSAVPSCFFLIVRMEMKWRH